jgi:DNA-binding CsgD family transcriptional regulator
MIQISEMNNSLISELASLNPYVNGKGSGIIRQIISRYGVGSDERIWEDFLTRFENVYESFYKRLQERFPDLTPGELRLCALLRLNVSTKDIAAITFQNPQSIDTARYRLRRKLNLDPDDNLVDFLLKLDS